MRVLSASGRGRDGLVVKVVPKGAITHVYLTLGESTSKLSQWIACIALARSDVARTEKEKRRESFVLESATYPLRVDRTEVESDVEYNSYTRAQTTASAGCGRSSWRSFL